MTVAGSPFSVAEAKAILTRAENYWSAAELAPVNETAHGGNFEFEFQGRGGRLLASVPNVCRQQFTNWLGRRLVWLPEHIRQQRLIGIVSSRIGKRPDLRPEWFDALRTAVIRCDNRQEQLCIVEGTAAAEIVFRAAELFDTPVVRVTVSETTVDNVEHLADWIGSIHAHQSAEDHSAIQISPAVVCSAELDTTAPAADRAAVLLPDRVIALCCRSKGNVESTLSRRLSERCDGSVHVVKDDRMTSPQTMKRLIDRGAIPLILKKIETASTTSTSTTECQQTEEAPQGPLEDPSDWLSHWTRPRFGPWPNQSSDEFLDELLLGCRSSDHSAMGSLLRIAESGVLLRSAFSRNCVSLTAVPLIQFRQQRTYRRHLQRYDFEPWGVALRKSVLSELGAVPVKYIDDAGSQRPEDLWKQHPRLDKSGRIDWSREREWRVPDDIRLNELRLEDVVFFVDSEAEAIQIRKLVKWSVISLPVEPTAENPQEIEE